MSKISLLPTTAFPSLDHVVPASHDGETHGLPLSQIRALLAYLSTDIGRGEGTVEDALADLENGKTDNTTFNAALNDIDTRFDGQDTEIGKRAVAQGSAADTTAGRGLIVGAFGLGGTGISIPDGNANNIAVTGSYLVQSTTTNLPAVANLTGGMLRAEVYSADDQQQIFYERGATANAFGTWRRQKRSGVWGAWIAIATAADYAKLLSVAGDQPFTTAEQAQGRENLGLAGMVKIHRIETSTDGNTFSSSTTTAYGASGSIGTAWAPTNPNCRMLVIANAYVEADTRGNFRLGQYTGTEYVTARGTTPAQVGLNTGTATLRQSLTMIANLLYSDRRSDTGTWLVRFNFNLVVGSLISMYKGSFTQIEYELLP